MMKRITLPLLATFLTVALTACSGDDTSAAPAGASTEVTVEPVGNEMQYEQTEITVRPGQTVHLTFDNTATSPSMQHNIVTLDTDDDDAVQRVGEDGLAAGADADYVPEDETVLAATPIANPGETVEVTFNAPEEPGTYRYICTFPGHWATMQGTLRVTGSAA